jgi:hypothetical protein
MTLPTEYGKRTRRWKSGDRFEGMVRGLLVSCADAFENHWTDAYGRGRFLPQMEETIPGQFNGSGHGVDIFGLDVEGRLWILEVSRGKRMGATVSKGGGDPVRYAGGALQMSEDWRREATRLFLDLQPNALAMLRDLLHLDRSEDAAVLGYFRQLYEKHRKGVVIPEGGYFDTTGTDIRFEQDVYTIKVRGL